jgi:hypothetical protein
MTHLYLLASILIAAAAPVTECCWFFRATLDGQHMVPPTTSMAYASASMSLDFGEECPSGQGEQMDIEVYPISDYVGAPISVRLCAADSGLNGPTLYELPIPPGETGLHTRFSFAESLCVSLHAGSLHVIVVTDSFPDGEVRGQLTPILIGPATKGSTWGTVRAAYR